jgi:hypothetical protein
MQPDPWLQQLKRDVELIKKNYASDEKEFLSFLRSGIVKEGTKDELLTTPRSIRPEYEEQVLNTYWYSEGKKK